MYLNQNFGCRPFSPAAKGQKRHIGRSGVCPNFFCGLLFTRMCTLILWIIRPGSVGQFFLRAETYSRTRRPGGFLSYGHISAQLWVLLKIRLAAESDYTFQSVKKIAQGI